MAECMVCVACANAESVSQFRCHRAGCEELYKTQGSCHRNAVVVYCVRLRAAACKPGVQSQEDKEDKKTYKLGTRSPSPLAWMGQNGDAPACAPARPVANLCSLLQPALPPLRMYSRPASCRAGESGRQLEDNTTTAERCGLGPGCHTPTARQQRQVTYTVNKIISSAPAMHHTSQPHNHPLVCWPRLLIRSSIRRSAPSKKSYTCRIPCRGNRCQPSAGRAPHQTS